MEKYVHFDSVDSLGRHFAEAIDITPRGGGLEKIAGARHPEIELYLRCLRPDPAYQYVLMTPMGAFEAYGMNSNGDIFPELALSFNRDKDDAGPIIKRLVDKWLGHHGKKLPPGKYDNFGHKTFLEAHRYRHHVNKDPSISYGDIVCAVWNPAMQRVEVIARHDREKAKRVGAEEIITDIDDGKPRQISMGCKVAFDVCTVCGHISRTQADYCEHLRTRMGSITGDGKVVGAVNLFPRFFDLSDVFVPAAKESGVLEKVARDKRYFMLAGRSTGKSTSTKLAGNKHAEIKKEILPNSGYRAVRDSCGAEPDIARSVLRKGNLGELLSTLAVMGIVLKPREFQDGMLHRMGHSRMADDLWKSNKIFRQSKGAPAATLGAPNMRLAKLLSSLIPERSAFYPHLPRRVIRIAITKQAAEAPRIAEMTPVLEKIAAAYDSYRKALRGLPAALDVAVEGNFDYYRNNFFGDLVIDSLQKTASFHRMDLSTPLVPLYVYCAHREGMTDPPASWELAVPSHSSSHPLLFPAI
jgi:hypothetical protein